MIRLGLLLVLLCFGCQTGRIPCPKVKGPKLIKSGKSYRTYSQHFPPKIKPEELTAERSKGAKPAESKFTRSVSIEEWDCPQPGVRKYKPRSVKENIRRNTRLIEQDLRRVPSDSILAH